jgi:ATP-dependent DNA helicase RecG
MDAPANPPDPLAALLRPARDVRGIGPAQEDALGRLLSRSPPEARDLLFHLPSAVTDHTPSADLASVADGERATLALVVDAHLPRAAPRLPHRVLCHDRTGFVHLVFFNYRSWMGRALATGATVAVTGRLGRHGAERQILHPEILEGEGGLRPVYPLARGIGPLRLRRAIGAVLEEAPDLPEWHDPALLAREGWPSWRKALERLHRPALAVEATPEGAPWRRLAHDELLAHQLALAIVRRRERGIAGRSRTGDGRLREALLGALPFRPTAAQARAAREIESDMAAPARMLRLLQGDVGSGKTLVALLAMLTAVEAGGQAVLMAPTEVLARQHAATLAELLAPIRLRPLLLTGRERGRERAARLRALASGAARLAVGTHALFQDDVGFADLALAVIDEQHRFGVDQRLTLAAKGKAVDLLVMTATPIPRSLALAFYGDLESSELREKPPGRTPVTTRASPLVRLPEIEAAIGRAIDRGERVYWVCPAIEGDGAAEARHERLRDLLGRRVGLVHGRMAGPDKDRAMADFALGRTRLLVATTVIEVGVDVPEATVMVIEHAERFGLAQLHQLRGRVGRGTRPSSCLLLYQPPLGATARARLRALRATDDGFALAEQDLKLRGPGELLGTRQSGLPEFKVADLAAHTDLLALARDDARLALQRDPLLESDRGRALRLLLRLFDREPAMAYLGSG